MSNENRNPRSTQKPRRPDERAILKAKAKAIRGISAQYGYLTNKYSMEQMFPAIFVCRNFKCNADYRIRDMWEYHVIVEDPHCACCGYELLQYMLRD